MVSNSASGSKLLLGLCLLAAFYLAALFIGTHVPFTLTPQDDPYSIDKLMHAAAFATLAVLLCAVGTAWLGASWKLFALVFVLATAYGALDEYTQSLVANRAADVHDWLADTIGAAVGTCSFVFLRRRVKSKI